MNIVDELLTHSFSARTYAEKKEIVTAGRPKPRLSELTEVTKQCTRRFWRNHIREIGLAYWKRVKKSPVLLDLSPIFG